MPLVTRHTWLGQDSYNSESCEDVPHRALLTALLERCIRDIISPEAEDRKQARRWFLDTRDISGMAEGYFSFGDVLDHLEIGSDIEQRIMRFVRKPHEEDRKILELLSKEF